MRMAFARRVGDLGRQRLPATARGQPARRIEHVLAVVQRLRRGVQLQRQHVAEILGHLQHVARLVGAHRHVILGVGAGRHRVHAGRMRTGGQIVDQRRGGVLHDHETGIGAVLVAGEERRQAVVGGRIDQLVEAPLGDRRQHRDRRLDVAHRQRQRHAVEMAGRDHLLLDEFGVALSGKINGLSVTAFSSISNTRHACAQASRTAPCTCGMQRRQ